MEANTTGQSLEARYREELKINTILERELGRSDYRLEQLQKELRRPKKGRNQNLKTEVTAAVGTLPDQFSGGDVAEYICGGHLPSITTVLKRMVEVGELTVVVRGSRGGPSIYRKLKPVLKAVTA